jgi:predicted small metal-binding protein
MPSFKCKDIGMNDNFEIKDDNQEELMKIVAMHAQSSHGIKDVSPEMMDKIKKAVKK